MSLSGLELALLPGCQKTSLILDPLPPPKGPLLSPKWGDFSLWVLWLVSHRTHFQTLLKSRPTFLWTHTVCHSNKSPTTYCKSPKLHITNSTSSLKIMLLSPHKHTLCLFKDCKSFLNMVARPQECIFQDINGNEHTPLNCQILYKKRGPNLFCRCTNLTKTELIILSVYVLIVAPDCVLTDLATRAHCVGLGSVSSIRGGESMG